MEQYKSIAIDIADVSLRSIDTTDTPFLLKLYASTRASEMAQVDWTAEQKHQFLSMQFNAQQQYYFENYQKATFDVIEWRDQSIGRLYVEEWQAELRIIDISLLPEYCDLGIGTHFLKKMMADASRLNKGVSIHVEKSNPAMRLYQRLGFEKVGEHSVYDLMEWGVA